MPKTSYNHQIPGKTGFECILVAIKFTTRVKVRYIEIPYRHYQNTNTDIIIIETMDMDDIYEKYDQKIIYFFHQNFSYDKS